MPKLAKARIMSESVEEFFKRVREDARKLDAGEELEPDVTISFESPEDMLRVLSAGRLRLLKEAKTPSGVTELASSLKRDVRAVSRDLDLLEGCGLIESEYIPNPGHGKKRVVSTRAKRYQLVANI